MSIRWSIGLMLVFVLAPGAQAGNLPQVGDHDGCGDFSESAGAIPIPEIEFEGTGASLLAQCFEEGEGGYRNCQGTVTVWLDRDQVSGPMVCDESGQQTCLYLYDGAIIGRDACRKYPPTEPLPPLSSPVGNCDKSGHTVCYDLYNYDAWDGCQGAGLGATGGYDPVLLLCHERSDSEDGNTRSEEHCDISVRAFSAPGDAPMVQRCNTYEVTSYGSGDEEYRRGQSCTVVRAGAGGDGFYHCAYYEQNGYGGRYECESVGYGNGNAWTVIGYHKCGDCHGLSAETHIYCE